MNILTQIPLEEINGVPIKKTWKRGYRHINELPPPPLTSDAQNYIYVHVRGSH